MIRVVVISILEIALPLINYKLYFLHYVSWLCDASSDGFFLQLWPIIGRVLALIQMMAAAEAGRDVCYFTYGDQELVHKMFQVHELIRSHNLTVGKKHNSSRGFIYPLLYL